MPTSGTSQRGTTHEVRVVKNVSKLNLLENHDHRLSTKKYVDGNIPNAGRLDLKNNVNKYNPHHQHYGPLYPRKTQIPLTKKPQKIRNKILNDSWESS